MTPCGPALALRLCPIVLVMQAACSEKRAGGGPTWPQWGQNAQHEGTLAVAGQRLSTTYLDYFYDPFVTSPLWVSSGASAHYMTPLTGSGGAYMETKSGSYSRQTYAMQTWGVTQFEWTGGALVEQWQASSDWKPPGGSADFWEPVFAGALANGSLYVPGAKGTMVRFDAHSGALVSRITPDSSWDANTYTVSPITTDERGNLYFTVIRLSAAAAAVSRPADEVVDSNQDGWVPPSPSTFYGAEVLGSFLVQVDPRDGVHVANIASLVPDAPAATDLCETTFADAQLPWPPSPTAAPPTAPCGTQRVGLNAAPAVAPDGTLYVVTRSHLNSRYAYLVSVNPDLMPRWDVSLRERFGDGCGVPHTLGGQLEPNGSPGGCAVGAPYGVDPATNHSGGGRVLDDSSASPVVAPDGSVFYGAYTSYNYSQGHLMHFSASGAFLDAYPFGWDTTPAVYTHDGTYSVVTKDNRYGRMGSYCSNAAYCPTDRSTGAPDYPEEYFVTQLSPSLAVQWQYRATNTKSCEPDADGGLTCVTDHPSSFEWCVNAPAIDAKGIVYVTSEDGWLYAIEQGGSARDKIFLGAALSAAYTPVSLDEDGHVYSLNSGHMFVSGQ